MKAKIYVGDEATGKTRLAKMISEYIGKENTVLICGSEFHMKNKFLFSEVTKVTRLIIIDDCPANFNYSNFFPVKDDVPYGGELEFAINVEKKGEKAEIIHIPYLIFTTNKLKPKWFEFGVSFSARFDIVQFPLSQRFKEEDEEDE